MDFLMTPFVWVMKAGIWLFNNYALALCFYALVTKVVLFPLMMKQQKNQMNMVRMRPYMNDLQKKYGNNKEKYNVELQKLYQREGYNPMSSCLPMIAQLVLIMLIYSIVRSPLAYVGEKTATDIYWLANESKTVLVQAAEEEGYKIVTPEEYEKLTDKQKAKATTMENLLGSTVNNAITKVETTAKERIAKEEDIKVSQVVLTEKNLTAADCSAMTSVDSEVYSIAEQAQDFAPENAKLDTNVPGGQLFGFINLSATPSTDIFSSTLLIPILAGLTGFLLSWLSQKTNSMTQDPQMQGGCSGKTMMYTMPLITVFFCFNVNCALGLYWTIGNVLGIGQHFILHKMYDPAKILAEAEAKIQREKDQKKAKKSAAAAKKAAAIEAMQKKKK